MSKTASPSPSVQGNVNFPEMVRTAAQVGTMLEGAIMFADGAMNYHDQLNNDGIYLLDLFEVERILAA